ncbi:RNA-binding protein [Ramlibacter sp. PS4R-6]|uniref:RNA-binding protein n=1 Tax=Ramlibacter sp. PS4R-6 TaxID=3133438 RepID=UPI0030B67031
MKAFAPDSKMYTLLGGVFYPTGHIFIMYPTAEEANDAERRLLDAGFSGDSISLLTPDDIHTKIASAVIDNDHMPSAGTEAATARHYEELAREGHHAILVPVPKAKDAELAVAALKGTNISYAQRYRLLVIEDIVGQANEKN